MKLSELWARSRNAVMDRVDTASSKAAERLVVVGGYAPSLSVKWLLVAILAAFLGGTAFGIWWDYSGFRQFRIDAETLAEKKEKENQKLSAELATLRAKLDAEEAANQASDRSFVEVINQPGSDQCQVPVGPLNILIVEASR